ncbi:MAG: manganese efflux pump [Clostridiales bacterium]|nr:manganese efflux pump [Clostridiales bacterium]
MDTKALFYVNSILFGVGLAIDAFIVALANGMNLPLMKKRRTVCVAVTFMLFQIIAVMIGWGVASLAFGYAPWIEIFFAWGAVAVLVFLGVKMIMEVRRAGGGEPKEVALGFGAIVAQCAATSVDALTVGFTIEEYSVCHALLCSGIIGAVTFIAYTVGFAVGKRFGIKFEKAASIIGGLAFIAIAVEIIVTTYIS